METKKCKWCGKEIPNDKLLCEECEQKFEETKTENNQIESPNVEALDKIEEVPKNKFLNKIKENPETIIIAILILIGLIGGIYILVDTNSSGSRSHHTPVIETDCDWCGKIENCKLYVCQYLAGFNRDGSFKYGYEYLHFSNSCYIKAKDSDEWLNIEVCD